MIVKRVVTYLLQVYLLRKIFVYFYTRAAEHMEIFSLTAKHIKNIKQSAISDFLSQCNCAKVFDGFNILATDSDKFKLLLTKSLLIKRDKLILNRTIKSFPLELFDQDGSFFSSITPLSYFFLIYNSNFVVNTDRATIYCKRSS